MDGGDHRDTAAVALVDERLSSSDVASAEATIARDNLTQSSGVIPPVKSQEGSPNEPDSLHDPTPGTMTGPQSSAEQFTMKENDYDQDDDNYDREAPAVSCV